MVTGENVIEAEPGQEAKKRSLGPFGTGRDTMHAKWYRASIARKAHVRRRKAKREEAAEAR